MEKIVFEADTVIGNIEKKLVVRAGSGQVLFSIDDDTSRAQSIPISEAEWEAMVVEVNHQLDQSRA